MDAFIGLWAIVFALFVLNGFAAGIVAALYVWGGNQARRSRALTAAGITGLVPLVMALPAVLYQASTGETPVVALIVGFAMVCGLAMAISLPGAVIIARKLDGPGGAYRTFE